MPTRYSLNPLVSRAAASPFPAIRGCAGGDIEALPPLDLCGTGSGVVPSRDLVAAIAALAAEPGIERPTPVLGLPDLRSALATDIVARYGGAVATEQIAITAGSSQALCLALMAIARTGDDVIVAEPTAFGPTTWLDMLGVRAVVVPFRPDRDGVPDPQQIAARLGPRTRAVLLGSPNSATGAVYPAELFEVLFNLCKRHSIALIVDEAYRDFVGDASPHRLFARSDWDANLVHAYSFSTGFGLPGYRVGALASSPALLDSVTKTMDCIAVCAPHLGQRAALFALTELPAWRPYVGRVAAQRRRALLQALEHGAPAFRVVSAGAVFAYLAHPFDLPSRAVARLLAEQQHLLTLPGGAFGPSQDGYLRLAYGDLAVELMPEVAARMRRSLEPRATARS